MTEGTVFKKLSLGRWRQFAKVEIDFHDRLTVLTGANGSGKSTLLNILARHVGSERPYFSVPSYNKEGVLTYLVGRASAFWDRLVGPLRWTQETQVGELEYSDGNRSPLNVPSNVGHSYNIEIPTQQSVVGLVIGSHSLLPNYQQLQHFSFRGIPPNEAFGKFQNETNQRYMGNFSGNSLLFFIKETLANWAAIGEGNKTFKADPRQKEAYDGFVDVLRKILPPSLGFLNIEVRVPEVVLVTKSGPFSIDAASGGITKLLEIGALIYGCSLRPDVTGKRFVVVYDEPENHLHPELQRTLFRNLTSAFPTVQFIAATHSPFIVSSLKDSNVYVLRYREIDTADQTEQSRVVAEKLDYANRAGNASEILREVLGLPTTLPQWVEDELSKIISRYQTRNIDSIVLAALKEELKTAGLEELYPQALAGLARTQ